MAHTFLALTALLFAPLAATPFRADLNDSTTVAPDKVPAKAYAFDLNQVQLLDGPFKHAQDLNRKLLLNTDLDQLLHPFRREAKLPNPAGGNDSYGWPFTGHVVGHYLSASALLWRNTGDAEIKKRADHVVAVLAECQDKIGTGYVMGMPEKCILRLEKLIDDPKYDADSPWYCLHKVCAGLFDMYALTGNRQALDVLEKSAGLIEKNLDQLNDQQMQAMLEAEHGGMKETLANLYAATGKEKYLKLAQRFTHRAMVDPFLEGKDPLDNHHANTQFPKFIGEAREYELTGDPARRTIVLGFWNSVANERSYVTGGDSLWEGFTPKASLSRYVTQNTCESCNEYNMLKLTRHLFCEDADAKYADYYERTLLNHVLSTRHPTTGGQIYFQQLQSGRSKTEITEKGNWMMPNEINTCCYGSGLESNSKYADSIYFHDGRNGLFINLFIHSVLDWRSKCLIVRQETKFPEEGRAKITFESQIPVFLKIHVRRPWWTNRGFQILVNGQPQTVVSGPGSYVDVPRTWQTGDTLEVVMPMSLYTEGFRDNPRRLAVMYGPLVLAAVTGSGNRFSAIRTETDDFLDSLRPVAGKPLEFTASPETFRFSPLEAGAEPVVFKPLLTMLNESYAVYWHILDAKDFAKKAVVYRQEAERQTRLEPRTVDAVLCGDADKFPYTVQGRLLQKAGILPRTAGQLSERTHGIKSENSEAYRMDDDLRADDDNMAWSFRKISQGGSFSYQMRVLPAQDQTLTVRLYCRGKQEPSMIDVLLDGQLLGTFDDAAQPRDRFTDITYPIPATLTKGKNKVEISIRSSKAIGGFYECRVLYKP